MTPRDCGHEDGIEGRCWYDRAGRSLCIECVNSLLGDDDYRRVAFTDLGTAEVSTVWLGLDHSFFDAPAPLIFETMIFHGPHHQDYWRYPTEAAALAGHDQVVAMLREESVSASGSG